MYSRKQMKTPIDIIFSDRYFPKNLNYLHHIVQIKRIPVHHFSVILQYFRFFDKNMSFFLRTKMKIGSRLLHQRRHFEKTNF